MKATSPSHAVNNKRRSAHDFMMRLEELVMALESAVPILDELVQQSDQISQLQWKRVKEKMEKLREE